MLRKSWTWRQSTGTLYRREKDLGSVEVGKRADLVLLDLRDPNLIPIHRKETVVSDIVYSANGQNVDTTIVDGSL